MLAWCGCHGVFPHRQHGLDTSRIFSDRSLDSIAYSQLVWQEPCLAIAVALKLQRELRDLEDAECCFLVSRTVDSALVAVLRKSLPSHIDAVSPFVDQWMGFVMNCRNGDRNQTEMAVREARVKADSATQGRAE